MLFGENRIPCSFRDSNLAPSQTAASRSTDYADPVTVIVVRQPGTFTGYCACVNGFPSWLRVFVHSKDLCYELQFDPF